MPASRIRLSRFVSEPSRSAAPALLSLSDFYREEVVRCQRCLEDQRDLYSAETIQDVERALSRVMASLDRLCCSPDAGEVLGRLLREFDVAAGLVNWSDPSQVH